MSLLPNQWAYITRHFDFMSRTRERRPKSAHHPIENEPRLGAIPDSYKTKKPVWRFSSFDWDGPWGIDCCRELNWRAHIEEHLASFETMTWAEIERAAGGRTHGTNSHPLSKLSFSRSARDRLREIEIFSDVFFSLRLTSTVRIYGIREDNCLRIVWIDPYHRQGDSRAAYGW